MNIVEMFDYVPPKDAFIDIHLESEFILHVLPEYEAYEEWCICIYGVSEEKLDKFFLGLVEKVGEYRRIIMGNHSRKMIWDIICKPIFLFDNRQTATVFSDFANNLCEEHFLEFISELERDYYLPWTHVRMIYYTQIYDILEPYERRYCCD